MTTFIRHTKIKEAILLLRGGADPLTQSAVKLLQAVGELEPYWQEPYAQPFVPFIEAGVKFADEIVKRGDHAL
jgi:hypothetical protein